MWWFSSGLTAHSENPSIRIINNLITHDPIFRFRENSHLPRPPLYLSAFFEVARRDYYDSLQEINERR
jgi:hypothetical protein